MKLESSVPVSKLRVDFRGVSKGFDVSTYTKRKEYYEFEKYKARKNIGIDKDYPLLLMEFNGSNSTASDIFLKIKLEINETDLLYFEINEERLPQNMILLNIGGIQKLLVSIEDVSFKIEGKQYREVSTNTPSLYDASDFEDFANDKTLMANYYSLSNYLDGSFYYRGVLLKLAFKNLEEISRDKFFVFDGKKYEYSNDNDLNLVRSLIQIDIISKIMMYIEDLIIILESNRMNKNYYELLDTDVDNKLDVGKRLGDFFRSLATFTPSDWRKMLCYIESDNSENKSSVDIVIEKNIVAAKNFLEGVDSFGKSHHKIFRRYKHAGFPIRYAGKMDLSKFFTLQSDFSSGLFVGKDMLGDIIFLPYSEEIIESYKILIPALQIYLQSIVRQRLDCITRKVSGNIPPDSFIDPNELLKYENDYTDAILKFQSAHPKKLFNLQVASIVNEQYLRDMTWYTKFEVNMKKWKENKEMLEQFSKEKE